MNRFKDSGSQDPRVKGIKTIFADKNCRWSSNGLGVRTQGSKSQDLSCYW